MPDSYLPVWVYDLPAAWAFQPDGALRDIIRHYVTIGVVKVVAGPTRCHVRIDVRRPYYRALPAARIDGEAVHIKDPSANAT